MWEGTYGGISKGDGDLARQRGSVKVHLVRGWALGCRGGRESTFGAGQRFLAQGAEAEALVEAAGLGLFQHPWASIHPMQLEEAPSLQLGWRTQSQFTPVTSQLDPCTSGKAVDPAVDIPQVFGTSESEGRARFLGPGVAGNLSK